MGGLGFACKPVSLPKGLENLTPFLSFDVAKLFVTRLINTAIIGSRVILCHKLTVRRKIPDLVLSTLKNLRCTV